MPNGGSDVIIGSVGLGPAEDDTAPLEGGRGADILIGGEGSDFIENIEVPLVGEDVRQGSGAGNDVVLGQDGNDFLIVNNGDGSDFLEGGAGNDTLLGNRGNDVVLGQDGNDLLIVNNGDGSDFLEQSDVLDSQPMDSFSINFARIENTDPDAGEGNDLLIGGDGNDVLGAMDDGIDQWVGGISEAPPAVDTSSLIAGTEIIG